MLVCTLMNRFVALIAQNKIIAKRTSSRKTCSCIEISLNCTVRIETPIYINFFV